MRNVLVAAMASLLLSLLGTPFAIRLFRAKGYGQLIRDDGPSTHLTKRGTPTMGGTVIIAATVVGYLVAHLVFLRGVTASGLLVLGLMTGLGAVGFLDDFIKIRKQRSLGLTATAKFGGQALVAVLFGILATRFANQDSLTPVSTHLSFVRDYGLDFGAVLFVVWAYIMVAATSNGVNLTDGLDGLAIGPIVMAGAAFGVIAYLTGNFRADYLKILNVRGSGELSVFCGALIGAAIGFLWFNCHPAEVFMGDAGSLALGASIGMLAVLTKAELLLPLIGGIYVVEAVSVIVQVASFKLTGRRVFRMAPLHHHYELTGWPEPKIVVRFWIVSFALALLALTTLKLR